MCGGGIAAGGEKRRVGLTVVVEAHRELARERVVGHETQFESCVTAAGSTGERGNVAGDGRLSAIAQVETHVEIVVGGARSVA